jgi:glutaminyl-tRNA synthetase
MDDKKPMPEATANDEPRDFIRDMVQADLARDLMQGISRAFHRSRTAICISATQSRSA